MQNIGTKSSMSMQRSASKQDLKSTLMRKSSSHNKSLYPPKITFFCNKNNKQKKVNILICQISEPSSEGTVLSALFFTSNGHFVNGADVCDVNLKKSHKESPCFVALNRRKKWLIHYSCPLLFTCPEQCVSRYE